MVLQPPPPPSPPTSGDGGGAWSASMFSKPGLSRQDSPNSGDASALSKPAWPRQQAMPFASATSKPGLSRHDSSASSNTTMASKPDLPRHDSNGLPAAVVCAGDEGCSLLRLPVAVLLEALGLGLHPSATDIASRGSAILAKLADGSAATAGQIPRQVEFGSQVAFDVWRGETLGKGECQLAACFKERLMA